MQLRLISAVVLWLCIACSLGAQSSLVIDGATIIDGSDRKPRLGLSILIRGDRIVAIDTRDRLNVPEGARTLDAAGKFVIPGLWDMHVHMTTSAGFPELYIANGITGVREMAAMSLPAIKALRKQIGAGKRVGPDIVSTGRIVDGAKPVWPGSYAAKDEATARKAVASLRDAGADFVKVYSRLSREAFFAVVEEAKKLGLPFAGHVPGAVTVAEASDAGQRSIEHLTGILAACSAKPDDVRAAKSRTVRDKRSLETFDSERAAKLYAKLAKNDTWQCPTLTVIRAIAHLDDAEFTSDDRMRYIPGYWKQFWNARRDRRSQAAGDDYYGTAKAVFRKSLAIVGAMHEAGVPILAGTDVANPYCFPGFSLHDELALLVQAGLTPLAALQAATRNAAVFLGRERDLGTVEVGKIASLAVLDADPLVNIRHTKKIHAVVYRGRLHDRKALTKILQRADRKR